MLIINDLFYNHFISYIMIFIFELFQNRSVITMYIGCVSNLDMFVLGCGKLKVLRKMYRFAVTGGEVRKLTVDGDRSNFLCSDRKFSFFLTACAS